ncbi:hypothetical protein BFI37_20795 [Yersinia pestis subsp. microtus bv. Caucasica]|nr:hypothetical protein BFI37_20795 [Yersinia pestis subsp. microtus bv. Caucasica]
MKGFLGKEEEGRREEKEERGRGEGEKRMWVTLGKHGEEELGKGGRGKRITMKLEGPALPLGGR